MRAFACKDVTSSAMHSRYHQNRNHWHSGVTVLRIFATKNVQMTLVLPVLNLPAAFERLQAFQL